MKSKPINITMPDSLIKRLDETADALRNDPELSIHGPITRSGLIRECVMRCLPMMEKRIKKDGKP